MENTNLTAADIAAVVGPKGYGYGDGMFGGDSWAWIILVILLGGGGFWGNNRNNDYITSPQFESANQFQALDRQLSGITYGIADSTFALNNAISNLGYRDLENYSNLRYESALGNKDIMSTIQSCCCETQKAIAAEGSATRALIQENKIEALRDKVNALELQAAVANTVKYPTTTAYCSGANPFAFNCGCNGNI